MFSGEWIRIQHDTPEQLCRGRFIQEIPIN